jgi:carboxypeptidase Taq
MEEKLARLSVLLNQVWDLDKAASVLRWDQQTYMPPGGAPARAEQLATLSRLSHTLFVVDEIGALLEALQPLVDSSELAPSSNAASLIRVVARDYEKMRRVPSELVAERARASALAQEVWARARSRADFSLFAPYLEKNVALNVELAEALGYEECLYDALLDQFEPEMKTSQVAQLFEELKTALVPLVTAITEENPPVDDTVLTQAFDEQKQLGFSRQVIAELGFDFERGRQDISLHPFTSSFSPNDVRLTTRVARQQLKAALFSLLHESGHGIYDQGIDEQLARTPLADGASLGVHESQSRLWENVVGRSRDFWTHYFPRLQSVFPQQLGEVDLETFYRAINKVAPSYIRVEADEVTYNLHIFIRFELEQALLEGDLAVSHLPEAWNEKMKAYLGLVPPDDALGVLQDIHWAGGAMGYFPTYALGNMLAVQFFNQALAERPAIAEQITRGEFERLYAWLRENIYQHGRKYTPAELTQRVTDDTIQAGPFIQYVKQKYGGIYNL